MKVCTRYPTVPDLRPSRARSAWRSVSSFAGMPVCPGTHRISVSIPASQRFLVFRVIHQPTTCDRPSSRCSVHRKAGCESQKTSHFLSQCICSVSLLGTDSLRASPIRVSSASYTSILPVPTWLRKAFPWRPCLHAAAASTLLSLDRDPSVNHIQTPAPTLASLFLTQWVASPLSTASSLCIAILTAASSSGLGQRMVSASRPRSCTLVMILHIGAAYVGCLCTAISREPSQVLASLTVNRFSLPSRATGTGVSPDSLISALIDVVGRAPRVDLAC